MLGRVERSLSGRFIVRNDDNVTFDCIGKGKLKIDGEVYVGDYVEFDERLKIITKLLTRKNYLTRPYVANVDYVVIVLSPIPEPDFYLADKILIDAIFANIQPVICLNKTDIDIDEKLKKRVIDNYSDVAKIIYTSVVDKDIDQFIEIVTQKKEKSKEFKKGVLTNTICLAGQSAVGKTSLLNTLLKESAGQIGTISEKSQRGKHTTRHNEIFTFKNGLIIDTSGFSELEIKGILPSEIKDYYADFLEYTELCKYKSCLHVSESVSECGVKNAVLQGKLCKERYDRYLQIYKDVFEKWKHRYT